MPERILTLRRKRKLATWKLIPIRSHPYKPDILGLNVKVKSLKEKQTRRKHLDQEK